MSDNGPMFYVPIEPQPDEEPRPDRRRKVARSKAELPKPKRKPAAKPTEMYRAYDAASILLYVGVSANTTERLKQHARDKTWWRLVADVEVQQESAYGDFLADEYEACVNEFPLFNIDGVPWRCWRPSTGREDFDRIRSRAEIAGAVARLDDGGVEGRLAALQRAYSSTYAAAVVAAGRPCEDVDTWRRRVLIAAEERHLNLNKKEVPGPRKARRKAAVEAWRWLPPKGLVEDELVLQLCLAVNEMTDEEVTAQVAELAAVRPLSWQEHRAWAENAVVDGGVTADRHAIRTLIAHYRTRGVWPIVVVPVAMRGR